MPAMAATPKPPQPTRGRCWPEARADRNAAGAGADAHPRRQTCRPRRRRYARTISSGVSQRAAMRVATEPSRAALKPP